ncbi:FMN-binding negative transcriptional regulator [Streptomyces sp. TLI_185]|uniref:FMN-binding negative transcriptional regulator n=1 Tax=Streptomyces sp. TLI_185 TaxID=2485151 RepID=UPI000F4ED64E|nr:FMN-binding negative transcriptional regulator [Streptomyces sp. TLI_185]RPF24816.1 PaiB family negative transcriptional regulator [Streptomyces sp. TLI_185]
MFVPSFYREPHSSWKIDLIRENPLALAVSNGSPGGIPFATHLPVICDPAQDGTELPADLSGLTLLAHMNRANPHWKALEDGGGVLLTFTGPHSYVSPTVYQVTPAAPTWNFTSVHVRGEVEKLDSMDDAMDVVQATVRAYERDFGTGWDMSESLGYFRKIGPAVGAFRVRVTGADGMFKLSQEQPGEVRERVRESFAGSDCIHKRATADLIGRLP